VITSNVKAAIFNDSSLKVNEINIETFKGRGPVEQLRPVSGGHRPGGPSRTRGRGREVRQEQHADQVTADRVVAPGPSKRIA
jgi:hypothetical protein